MWLYKTVMEYNNTSVRNPSVFQKHDEHYSKIIIGSTVSGLQLSELIYSK